MGRSGGGRSGGGGRSSGGRSGGGRSFGGRSGGGRSGGSSSYGGYSGGSRGHSYHSHGHRHHYYGGRRRRSNGCASVVVFILMIIVGIIYQTTSVFGEFSDEYDVTPSTVAREPLPKGSVVETDYYTDEIGDWIRNPTKLTAGMKNFYNMTGVQPYLYITDNLSGNINPTDNEAEIWMNNLYDTLFRDEAHTLLVFYERNSQYSMWYLNGKQAKIVMDNEAMDILMDYVELYYYSDMTEDEMFSKAYDMAAKRIMNVSESSLWKYVGVFFLVVVFIIIIASTVIFIVWRRKRNQSNINSNSFYNSGNFPNY